MANTFQISAARWVEEANELVSKGNVFLSALLPYSSLHGNWYQFEVNEQAILVRLESKSPSRSAAIAIQISLPTKGYGRYEKRQDEAGKTILSAYYLWGPDQVGQLSITDDISFLIREGFYARLQ